MAEVYVFPNAISIRQFESLGVGCIRKEVFDPATACSNKVIKVLTSSSTRKFSCYIPCGVLLVVQTM
ncbi:hypothetical protein C5167_005670 [Papaver somniferum]|uniref:Uncharacterized protein n=1 Tax=Papaver somniferum TaxID=3469 RepID=A0A4Y7JFF6_PAPSO|nr:hypothetical protein C5167_005670 [Papaver somniferum]